MSRPRFLADHNFNGHVVRGLLRREPLVEAVLARDVGLERSPDPELLEYAANHGLVLLTHDVNTMVGFAAARMTAGKPMTGLLAIPQWLAVRLAIDELLLVWAAMEAEELIGQAVFLPV